MLSSEGMKPSKLIRHLEAKHFSLKHKSVKFFERKVGALNDQRTSNFKVKRCNKSTVEASYKVSLRIAKMCKANTITESVIVSATEDAVKAV
jgi:hypothetical protein